MFTGLIETRGEVAGIEPSAAGLRLRIRTSLAGDLGLGESVAVNGVCLTVVDGDGTTVAADIAPETARVTTLGGLSAGAPVNLERSMRADGRIGGHFVQGHVDATGTIESVQPEGGAYRVTVSFPHQMASLLVAKGSVAIDGVSLTVASLERDRFDVQVIPFTWTHTNLEHAAAGTPVNLEFDILGKYVARALAVR